MFVNFVSLCLHSAIHTFDSELDFLKIFLIFCYSINKSGHEFEFLHAQRQPQL